MISTVITQLEQLLKQIQASGPVAHEDARLDISTHSKSGYEYARLRNGSELSACGRVGSEKYLEALATLQRRDKILCLTQAISSLKQADALPVTVPAVGKTVAVAQPANESSSVAKSKSKPKSKRTPAPRQQKAKGRKQLYTHVRTRQGTVVHAVLGKDKNGPWHTAALCGATPPERDRRGWEFPTHDDGVTCPKCYRNLPANGTRYLPVF